MPSDVAAPDEWTPHPGSTPSLILSLLDPIDARPLPALPGIQPSARYTATHRLHVAGYLARHEQPGETEARWTVTETGQRARQRSETGLTVRQARVLLLIPPHGITAQTLTRAYNALYGDHARELMYQSLAALQGLGVLQRSSSPAKWTLTVLGRTRIRDAAFRLTLDTPAPGPS